MKALGILCTLLWIQLFVVAQNNVSVINLKDDSTHQAIMFAHLLWSSGEGSVSNKSGYAHISYPKNLRKSDSLKITCVGYHSLSISYRKLRPGDTLRLNMKAKNYSLSVMDIEAKGLTPYQIVQSALGKLRENYPQETRYYKCAYNENHANWFGHKKSDKINVYSEFILEDPAYKRIHRAYKMSYKNPLTIIEKIYFLQIDKVGHKVITPAKFDPLKGTIHESVRYRNSMLNNEKSYHYELKKVVFDSLLNNHIMHIHIRPKDTAAAYVFCDVYITSKKHQILEIHTYTFGSKMPDEKPSYKDEIFRYGDDDYIIKYRINENNEVVPDYFHQIYNTSFYNPKKKSTTSTFNIHSRLKIIGEIENAKEVIGKLPEMEYELPMTEQPFFKGQSFILNYKVELKK